VIAPTFTIVHTPLGFEVSARADIGNYFIKDKEVGYARFVNNGNGTYSATTIFVYPEYRRQYVATRLYEFVRSQGFTITPAVIQTDLGKMFWKKINAS
jgi:ribosomal protein S18 acetylase RimI-like enzyme